MMLVLGTRAGMFSMTYMLLERHYNPSVSRLLSGFQALRHRLEPVVSRL